MANFNTTATFTGLTTFTVIAPTTDAYEIAGTLTLPTITQGSSANSQCVVTVAVNSSTQYTSSAGQEGFACLVTATAGQTISVTTSSSAPVDQTTAPAQPPVRCTVTIDERSL
jgi:hypothetical protein